MLGYEQRFLGTARVERFADVSTVRITTATRGDPVGDRLVPAPREQLVNYVPHAPDKPINGRIIATGRDSIEVGPRLDRHARQGQRATASTSAPCSRSTAPSADIADPRPSNDPDVIEYPGYATPFLRAGPDVPAASPTSASGLMFVFRVFDRVSYALVLNTTDPVRRRRLRRASPDAGRPVDGEPPRR